MLGDNLKDVAHLSGNDLDDGDARIVVVSGVLSVSEIAEPL